MPSDSTKFFVALMSIKKSTTDNGTQAILINHNVDDENIMTYPLNDNYH